MVARAHQAIGRLIMDGGLPTEIQKLLAQANSMLVEHRTGGGKNPDGTPQGPQGASGASKPPFPPKDGSSKAPPGNQPPPGPPGKAPPFGKAPPPPGKAPVPGKKGPPF